MALLFNALSGCGLNLCGLCVGVFCAVLVIVVTKLWDGIAGVTLFVGCGFLSVVSVGVWLCYLML